MLFSGHEISHDQARGNAVSRVAKFTQLIYLLAHCLRFSFLLTVQSLRQRVTDSVDMQWCVHIEHKAEWVHVVSYMLITALSIPDISAKHFNF